MSRILDHHDRIALDGMQTRTLAELVLSWSSASTMGSVEARVTTDPLRWAIETPTWSISGR